MRVLHVTDDLAGVSGIRSYLESLTDEVAGSGPELEAFAPSGELRKGAGRIHQASTVTPSRAGPLRVPGWVQA